MQLHEEYRPKQWSEVVGQDKAIEKIETVAKRGIGGRAFFLSGQSGTGKTTIAYLIAQEIADEFASRERLSPPTSRHPPGRWSSTAVPAACRVKLPRKIAWPTKPPSVTP